jgi:hypothetical protein
VPSDLTLPEPPPDLSCTWVALVYRFVSTQQIARARPAIQLLDSKGTQPTCGEPGNRASEASGALGGPGRSRGDEGRHEFAQSIAALWAEDVFVEAGEGKARFDLSAELTL